MESCCGCLGVRCCKPCLGDGGGVALGKGKKEEPKGLSKRDVGPEGRKRHKIASLSTAVERPEGEAGVGKGKGHLVWIYGVQGLLVGLPRQGIQLTAQMSHWELSKMLEWQMVKGYHWPRMRRDEFSKG